MLQMKIKFGKLNLIQIYTPMADKDENQVEQFYDRIDCILNLIKQCDVIIIIGDLNAKIGKGKIENWVGECDWVFRMNEGKFNFTNYKKHVVTITFFKLQNKRLYTWKFSQACEHR